MSITFSVEFIPTGRFAITCYAGDEPGTVAEAGSYDAIMVARAAHMAECEDCRLYGCYSSTVVDVDESVNFANGNARAVAYALDLDLGDDCGRIAPEDLLARITLAEVLGAAAEAVRPTVAVRLDGGAELIECGINEAYMVRAFGELERVATVARDLGREVVWS